MPVTYIANSIRPRSTVATLRPRGTSVHTMRTLLVLCAVIAATSTATVAESLDPHAVYEQRCAACHLPHARELAESALDRRDGKVVLKTNLAEPAQIEIPIEGAIR